MTTPQPTGAGRGCLGASVIFALLFIVFKTCGACGPDDAVMSSGLDTPYKPSPQAAAHFDSLSKAKTAQLGDRIKSFNVSQYVTSEALDAMQGAGQLEEFAEDVGIALASDDKELAAKAKKWKADLVRLQVASYPKLRKAWAAAGKQRLWEDDIDLKVFGKGYTVLEFVGGAFAANRNIQETQEMLSGQMKTLRFKRVNYKWYAGADEYDYYTLDTKPDSAIE